MTYNQYSMIHYNHHSLKDKIAKVKINNNMKNQKFQQSKIKIRKKVMKVNQNQVI